MSDLASVQIKLYGHVQGVFFRAFTERAARRLGLTGYVRNLSVEPAIEVQAEGERQRLRALIRYLRGGPQSAKVIKVVTKWSAYSGDYSHFGIKF